MRRSKCVWTKLLPIGLVAASAAAQTPASQPAPPADPPASNWILGPVQLSGLIDGYYSLNFNHPASMNNQLRNFDVNANQFSLNMAKVTLQYEPDPIGFRLDFGFGRAFDIINGSEKSPSVLRNVEQAYASIKPAQAKGLEIDFGKFVTSAGAEVIETKDDWNYSRSLLFAWAIPYYHFGLRTSFPVGKYFTGGVQLVNGWNNVEDNNSGKTVGLTGAINAGKVIWYHNYYFGPEKADTNKGWRRLYDTTVLVNPTSTTSFYINADYGVDNRIGGGSDTWGGVAGAARFALTPKFALAPRAEWFNDPDGFSTGTVQSLKEVTMTAEYTPFLGLITRFEYRRDWSNQPFFDRGNTPASSKSQSTLLAGVIVYFGPKQ
jgi:hypothetical protein